jgi:hypothetical protein
MILMVDLDGVVCTEEKTFERALAKPISGAREALDALAAAGHTIIVYSARSWAELKMTEGWLKSNGITYHGLHMGKPVADWHIDDRAIKFEGWPEVLDRLQVPRPDYSGGVVDESLLRILRQETKVFLEAIASRTDLLEPILEVGPMTRVDAENSIVFRRMPETFVDSRSLFTGAAYKNYKSMDIDPSSKADIIGDFSSEDNNVASESVGTIILMSCLEHLPKLWAVPKILKRILVSGGRAFILTPWNLRFHGPRPDCWRISDDGYRALFAEHFEIESIEQIPCPERPLSPVGLKCVLRKA